MDKIYRLVKIERGIEAVPVENLEFDCYPDAWNYCVDILIKDPRVSGFFVYSTGGTGIYLKRGGVGVQDAIIKRRKFYGKI